MSASHKESPDEPSTPSHNSATFLLGTIADTTWRMFVPPGIGAIVGWQLEKQGIDNAAVWGATIGVIIAGLLVRQQYRAVNKDINTR